MSIILLVTGLTPIVLLGQVAFPLVVMANFTASVGHLIIPSLMPKDTREFFLRTYAPNELAPSDVFCYKQMASTCPFLASRTARPTSSTNVKVRVRVDFWLTHFAGINDLNQQWAERSVHFPIWCNRFHLLRFSVVGTFVFNWQLPRCARWLWTSEQLAAVANRTAWLNTTISSNNATFGSNQTATSNMTVIPPLPFNKNVAECRFKKTEIWHPAIKHINAISKPDVFES